MLLLRSDLYNIQDQTARRRAAIKVLEEMGYEVELFRRGSPRVKPTPNLKVVGDDGDAPVTK